MVMLYILAAFAFFLALVSFKKGYSRHTIAEYAFLGVLHSAGYATSLSTLQSVKLSVSFLLFLMEVSFLYKHPAGETSCSTAQIAARRALCMSALHESFQCDGPADPQKLVRGGTVSELTPPKLYLSCLDTGFRLKLDYIDFLTWVAKGDNRKDWTVLATYKLSCDNYLWFSVFSCTRKLQLTLLLFAGVLAAMEGITRSFWMEEVPPRPELVMALQSFTGRLVDLMHMAITLTDILNVQSGRHEEDMSRKSMVYKHWAGSVATCKLLLVGVVLNSLSGSSINWPAHYSYLLYMALCAVLASVVQRNLRVK
jgi:hypothetical protein